MPKEGRKTRKQPVPIWIWLVVALVIIGGGVAALYFLGQSAGAAIISESNVPKVGSPTAPIHVYLFEDYQCPICYGFEIGHFPPYSPWNGQANNGGTAAHLYSTWVDTGKVEIIYKPVNILDRTGTGSTNGAEAAICAYDFRTDKTDDGTTWHAYHHQAYVAQGPEGGNWATPAFYRSQVQQWGGMNMASYDSCIAASASVNPASILNQDMKDWNTIQPQGTPAMYVGNQLITPSQSNSDMDSAIQLAWNKLTPSQTSHLVPGNYG